MSNKIIFRNEELNDAISEFIENASEDTFIGIIVALANAYQQEAVFPVAAEGEVFRTIHDDEDGDFLSMFSDLDQAEMGPETDLILMTMEDLAGNIMGEHELSGVIINAFSDPIFVDRDAMRAVMDTALSGPYKEVTIDLEEMDVEEMVDLADEIASGEAPYVADPLLASSIYRNVIDDDLDLMPDPEDQEELDSFKATQALAMRRLGELYMTGNGVEYDPAEAKELFEAAAKEFDTGALYNLGVMAEERGDHAEAADLYEQAAMMGEPKALAAYGRLLLNGTGLKADPKKALMYLRKAVESDEADEAYYYIGLIYEEGMTGEKDPDKAGNYYELGAEAGDVKAMKGYQRIFGVPYEEDDDDDDEDDDDEMTFETDDNREFFIDMSKLPKGIKN